MYHPIAIGEAPGYGTCVIVVIQSRSMDQKVYGSAGNVRVAKDDRIFCLHDSHSFAHSHARLCSCVHRPDQLQTFHRYGTR